MIRAISSLTNGGESPRPTILIAREEIDVDAVTKALIAGRPSDPTLGSRRRTAARSTTGEARRPAGERSDASLRAPSTSPTRVPSPMCSA
jgi:hypothetical protein